MPPLVRTLTPHLMALAVVAIAASVRSLLDRPLEAGAVPFITFFPAVVIAAWYGGMGPGITASVASYLAADWWFVPPEGLALVNGDGFERAV